MESLFYHISQVLGITIIHSLWQGLIIYFVLQFLLQCFPALPSAKKYTLAGIALVSMAGWFIYTLIVEAGIYNWNPQAEAALPPGFKLPLLPGQTDNRYYIIIAGYLPYVTATYITGLLFNSVKFAWAWQKLRRVKQNLMDTGYQQIVDHLAAQLNISQKVQISFSQLIDAPCMIGFIKPIILLPVTLTTSLNADEITVIILHELAHIRRKDYLFNLAQQLVSILLFFNPFSYLLNGLINRERENCCDDIVVAATNKPLVYAQALLKIEESRQQHWQLALAATGKKHHLLTRIERIMKTKRPIANIRPVLITILLLTISLSSIAWLNPKVENGKVSVARISPQILDLFNNDTINKTPVKAVKRTKTKTAKKAEEISELEYKKLAADFERHADAIHRYYQSPEFKKIEQDLKINNKAFGSNNNPEMDRLQEQLDKKSAEFEKLNNNPDFKKKMAELEATNQKMQQFYSSKAFQDGNKAYEKAVRVYEKAKPGTAEYKKYEAELKAAAEQYRKLTTESPEFKEQKVMLNKLSAEARAYYNGAEYRKAADDIKIYADSVQKIIQRPEFKQQRDDMMKAAHALQKFQQSPEIVRETQLLQETQEKLRQYQRSHNLKKRGKEASEKVSADIDKLLSNSKTTVTYATAVVTTSYSKAMNSTTDTQERTPEPAVQERGKPDAATQSVNEIEIVPATKRRSPAPATIQRTPAKARQKTAVLNEIRIEEPVKEVQVKPVITEIRIEEPNKQMKPVLNEIRIEEPKNNTKPVLKEIRIDEPVKEIKPEKLNIRLSKPESIRIEEPVKEIRIDEPVKETKPEKLNIKLNKPVKTTADSTKR